MNFRTMLKIGQLIVVAGFIIFIFSAGEYFMVAIKIIMAGVIISAISLILNIFFKNNKANDQDSVGVINNSENIKKDVKFLLIITLLPFTLLIIFLIIYLILLNFSFGDKGESIGKVVFFVLIPLTISSLIFLSLKKISTSSNP
ncbi:MAG: hypothetical protein WC444_02435 [Candidatus Paceibacterota bacterium]